MIYGRSALRILILAILVVILTAVGAMSAFANEWVGGINNYNSTGVYCTIKTCSPRVSSGQMSSAWVMADNSDGSEAMQEGWSKDLSTGISYPQCFWEWWTPTHADAIHYWGAPGVGGTHQYKVAFTSDGNVCFYLDGNNLTHTSGSWFTEGLNQIEFEEEKTLSSDQYGGTSSNPCTFNGGFYQTLGPVYGWFGTYYQNRKNPAGTAGYTSAGNSSNSFVTYATN